MTEDRNRITVRRGLRAGGAVALFIAVVGIALVAAGDVPLRVVLAIAFAAGAFVAAVWLLLAFLLDLVAGFSPDRRRILWTVGTVLVAMLGPFLLVGVFVDVSGGGS